MGHLVRIFRFLIIYLGYHPYFSIISGEGPLPGKIPSGSFVREISQISDLLFLNFPHNLGSSLERSSLLLTSGVSPPQPSAGSCKQKKKTFTKRKRLPLAFKIRVKDDFQSVLRNVYQQCLCACASHERCFT